MKDRRITLKDKDGRERAYTLRYRLSDRREIERECGKGLWDSFTGGMIENHAAIIWGGLTWKNRSLTVEKVLQMLEQHVEGGGDVDAVLRHALWACVDNGLLKPRDADKLRTLMPDPSEQEEEPAEEETAGDRKGEAAKAANGY